MERLFDYTLYGIEAKYKQDRFYKEAQEYRLLNQLINNKGKTAHNSVRHSFGIFRPLRVSHS